MIPLSLARIAQVTGGQLHGTLPPLWGDAVVSGEVVIDSRRVGPRRAVRRGRGGAV